MKHVGRAHAQDQWEASDPVLAIDTENASVKITSRRSGELPEEIVALGLDEILKRHRYYYRGRSDCPERVTKQFDKRQQRGYDMTRTERKDLTEEFFTAKTYQEVK